MRDAVGAADVEVLPATMGWDEGVVWSIVALRSISTVLSSLAFLYDTCRGMYSGGSAKA